MKILSLITHPYVLPSKTFVHLWNTNFIIFDEINCSYLINTLNDQKGRKYIIKIVYVTSGSTLIL